MGDVFSRADNDITGGLSRGDFVVIVVINADSIKEKLIGATRAGGSLESFIKPPVVRELEAGSESFSDLDFASLVREESAIMPTHPDHHQPDHVTAGTTTTPRNSPLGPRPLA